MWAAARPRAPTDASAQLVTSKEALSHTLARWVRQALSDPEDQRALERYEREMRRVFEASFAFPLLSGVIHGFLSLAVFGVYNALGASLPAPFLAGALTALLSTFPFVSPSFVCTPWVLHELFVRGQYWVAGGLYAAHYVGSEPCRQSLGDSRAARHPPQACFWAIDSLLLESFSRHRQGDRSSRARAAQLAGSRADAAHASGGAGRDARAESSSSDATSKRSFATGLAFFLGISAFGMHGVVFGPMILSFLVVTFEALLMPSVQRAVRRVSSSRAVTDSPAVSLLRRMSAPLSPQSAAAADAAISYVAGVAGGAPGADESLLSRALGAQRTL